MNISGFLASAAIGALATFATPIVQVRDLSNAPSIAVVAWDAENADYGLRTRLRRDGSHLGEGRLGEHRLYISSTSVSAQGAFAHATTHKGKLLRSTASQRDMDACRFDNVCSPTTTVGLGISDEMLRENRDSLVVTLRPQTGRSWTIRIDGSVIGAYLATIDSVSASLRKD